MPSYPNILKRVMKDYRLTQVILAKVMGVGQGVISKYLLAISIPDADFMANLAIEFKLNPYVLVKDQVKDFYLQDPDFIKFKKYREPRKPWGSVTKGGVKIKSTDEPKSSNPEK